MTSPPLHPDHNYIQKVSHDLDAWLATTASEPTSQVLGTGAVYRCEQLFSERFVNGQPCLLLPSATFALYTALRVLKVTDRTVIVDDTWPAARAAAEAAGAEAISAPVAQTGTLDPAQLPPSAASAAAIIATHQPHTLADIHALRQAAPQAAIIEDSALTLTPPAGTLGDLAIFSFGPGKPIDVDEAAMLTSTNPALLEQCAAFTSHPAQALLRGIQSEAAPFNLRPHPIAAIRLAHALHKKERQRNGHTSVDHG